MDLNIQHINWVGNIYQKFEAVCQEVDDIVGQDAVKYLENQVQNVGDSMKKFYSGVVHEILPFPTLVSSKHEAHSVAVTNNDGFSVESVGANKDNNKKRDDESPMTNFIKPLQDSNAIDIDNNQQGGVPIKHDPLNQVSDETCSDSQEMEDSCITQEEVGDDSTETSGAKKETLHTSAEEVAVKSVPRSMDLISVSEKEPLEFPIHSESYSNLSDSECKGSIMTKDNIDVNAGQNSCLIVDENAMNSSTSLVLSSELVSSSQSLDEEESIKGSLFIELSDIVDEDRHGILAEVSPDASVSSERPIAKTEPLCFRSFSTSDSLCSNSRGSFSTSDNSGDANLCLDSSMVHTCCESSHHATGQIMESHDGLVFSGYCQCMGSNDEALFSSIESGLEDIQLNDDLKLEESCIFVDDSELYAVSSRTQKLRSYKKRIRDAFASKKRLAKEYEQLAIWYGDTDIEPNQCSSQTSLPFSSRTNMESKNVQHASETEWELL